MMAAEIMVARQLDLFRGARQGRAAGAATSRPAWPSCSAARVAWAAADNALQIHGGNGFALEYPISRVLCDARILNIFEGAGESRRRSSPGACWKARIERARSAGSRPRARPEPDPRVNSGGDPSFFSAGAGQQYGTES